MGSEVHTHAGTSAAVGTGPTPLGDVPMSLVPAPDERHLYVSGQSNRIAVLDTTTHQVVDTFGSALSAEDMVFSHDGSRLYLAGVGDAAAPFLTELDVHTRAVTRTATLDSWPFRLVLTLDGRRLYLTLPDARSVAVVDTNLWKVIRTIAMPDTPLPLAASSDGRRVYVGGASSVQVIDTDTDTLGAPINLEASPNNLVVTPEGSSVFAAVAVDDKLRGVMVVDTASGGTSATIPLPATASDAAISADGARIYLANGGSAVAVIDTARRELIRTLSLQGRPFKLAVLRSGHRGYAIDPDASTVLPFLTRTVAVRTGPAPEAVVSAPDGGSVYTADSGGGTVTVVDTVDRRVPTGQDAYKVAVTPDGRYAFVSNDTAGTVSRVETATGTVSGELSPDGGVGELAVRSDGRLYVVGAGALNAIDTDSLHGVARTALDSLGIGIGTALSPDGKRVYVLTTGPPAVVTLDAGTLAEVHPPVPLGQDVDPLALTVGADGRHLFVSTTPDDMVSVLDTAAFQVVARLRVGANPSDLVASPDGRRLYAMCQDAGTVSVIDAVGLTTVGETFPAGPAPVSGALDGKAGRLYVLCSDAGVLVALDAGTGTELERYTVDLGAMDVALTPDGRYAYVAVPNHFTDVDGGVSVIDTHTTRIPVGNRPMGLALSPARRRLYVAEYGAGTVSILGLVTRTAAAAPVSLGGRPHALALSHDESRLYVADAEGSVRVVDTATDPPAPLPAVPVTGTPAGLAVPADGSRVYVADSSGGTLTVIDTAGATPTAGAPVALAVAASDVCVTPGGGRLYVADAGADAVLIVDPGTLSVTARIELPGTPAQLALTQDGRRLLVTLPAAGTLAQVDTATLSVWGDPIPVGHVPHAVTVTADGRRACVTDVASGTLALVDL
ncbi:hypothetical protein ACWDZX_08100 [Streptomyces collinus]